MGPKGDDYHLVHKVVAVMLKSHKNEFSVQDLLSLDLFTGPEKKRLTSMFDTNFSAIEAWDARFDHENGKWKYSESTYDHERITRRLLVLMNKKTFSPGSIVSTKDLSLIRRLIAEWDAMFVKDWELSRGDEAPRFEITWRVLQFISNNMEQRIGEYSIFNFDFAKTFLEAYQDHTGLILEDIILGRNRK